MQITRSGEYGLRGVLFLARQPAEKFTLVSEISKYQHIPETFLAKIFQRLSKAGLLRSSRGSKGGFSLGKPAGSITMREVIEAIDGPITLNRCLRGGGECDEEGLCPIYPVWSKAQKQLLEILDSTTVGDLARQMVRNEKKRREEVTKR
jgi:Rrf2 family transcriptional regulator, iron-sulfur cluster assembly transcription factor